MKSKYRILLGINVFLILLTMFIGSSYSYWKATKYQTGVNLVETGCFEIDFIEKTSSINLNNAYPIADAKGFKTTPYTFKIQNKCNIDASYTIYLNRVNKPASFASKNDSEIIDNFIKYSLNETGDTTAVANYLKNATKNTELTSFEYNIDDSYILATGTLEAGEATTDINGDTIYNGEDIEYNLRLWIDGTATTDIEGETFEAALSVIAVATDLNS